MLTEAAVRGLKPKDSRYMVRDSQGLYLEVMVSGGKCWRLRCWIKGKEHKRSLGVYPQISLREARLRRDEVRLQIARGEDPFKTPGGGTFEDVSREWFQRKIVPIRAQGHARTVISRLERHVFPFVGTMPVQAVSAPDLLELLRRIETKGHYETAHRTLQICGQVFRYAIASGLVDRDPSADLKGALVPVISEHYPTITDPEQVGGLMRAMEGYTGSLVVRCALKFGVLTFVRPGELRCAEWSEFDYEKSEWWIPAEKMKMTKALKLKLKSKFHVVPLSAQALDVLEEIRPFTGNGRYVFPSLRTRDGSRPISDMAVNAALRGMGYSREEMTGHGFRSMASTILNEQGWPADAIERQLAHAEKNAVRAAYNHAEHLEVRRKMMQAWADWLEETANLSNL